MGSDNPISCGRYLLTTEKKQNRHMEEICSRYVGLGGSCNLSIIWHVAAVSIYYMVSKQLWILHHNTWCFLHETECRGKSSPLFLSGQVVELPCICYHLCFAFGVSKKIKFALQNSDIPKKCRIKGRGILNPCLHSESIQLLRKGLQMGGQFQFPLFPHSLTAKDGIWDIYSL